MREMKDSGIEWIGKIPVNWNKQKIKYTLTQRVKKNNPVICKSILSLTAKQGVVPYSEKEGAGGNKPKEDYSSYNLAYPNDIVMNSMNVISGSVGLSKYFGCVSPVYYMFYSDTNDIRFFNYIFQTSVFQRSLLGLGNGILMKESDNGKFNTVRMRIPMDKLGLEFLPVCSLSEQHKIADFLDQKCSEIDALTADIQIQIETLEEYKKSVITEAVTKGLDPNVDMKDTGIEWLSKIPLNWSITKAKYVFKQRNEKGNKISLRLLSPTQRFGVIPQDEYEELTGMKAVKLNEKTDYSLLKTIHKGDYCISLRSFQGGFEYSEYEGVVSPAYQVFFSYIPIERRFFKYIFKDQSFIEKMNSFTLSLRDGKNIAFDDFGNSYIPIPPFYEQQKIADFLDKKCSEIDLTISEKQQQLETLAEYKKSLIYEYVTGKKEVA